MDFDDWFKLAATCFLGAISPAPSLALVASNALVRGKSYGVVTGRRAWSWYQAVGFYDCGWYSKNHGG